tara:strand:+ start:2924 stop:3808 length:885 start_codon:yes stop_codon:yes gene_type:complete
MPKVDKTGLILIGGAVGLGLILLPGFFSGRLKAKEEEDEGLVPSEIAPFDWAAAAAEADASEDKKKKKTVLVAVGRPDLIVEANTKSYAYGQWQSIRGNRNRGVGSHMQIRDVDAWGATNVDVIAEWEIKNPSAETLPLDFVVSLRQTRDFTTKSFLFGKGWASAFGRDRDIFKYTPKDGITDDEFFDAFGESVQTTHGATRGSRAVPDRILPGETRKLKMGLHLPGPARSKELREFWEAKPQFNFRIEAHQGQNKFAEHEFKDAFSLSIVRPELIALPSTGRGDSPRLTIKSL